MNAALLRVDCIHTYYDQSHILQGASLSIPAGAVVAVLGRNGVGKTTLLKSIMGVTPVQQGSIYFDGVRITHLPPYRIARLGIGWVPEDRAIFTSLSVHENLNIAVGIRGNGAWDPDRAYQLFPRLAQRRSHTGGQLSGGEQQMLSIARSLMLNPKLLLLDEPTEGLAPTLVEEIAIMIAQLKKTGMTILLVEQNYAFATVLADAAVVLGKGQVRWRGSMAALRVNEEIKGAWLGL